MNTFEVYLTIAGQVILSKLLAGEKISLTRAVLSSQTSETPEELTVVNPESLETTQIALTDHGTYTNVELSFELRNLESDLDFHSIGIYGQTDTTNETLIYVAMVGIENQMVIPAHSPINYVVSLKETFAQGQLQVQTSPSYATPISHNSDFTRHIFSQTNDSNTIVLVNSGVDVEFTNGDSILFIPKVDIQTGKTLRMASNDYTLAYKDIQGNALSSGVFKAHRAYVLYFNNDSFIYKEKEITVSNGDLTYWTGSEYKTAMSSNSFRVQNGIIHYYSNGAWHSTQPAGVIYAFARSSALTGYLLCDGSTLSKNNYPELYAVIGHYYGGSGDNFKLPDLRGRTLLGVNSSHSLGSTGGSEKKTIQISNLPSHSHTQGKVNYTDHTMHGLWADNQFVTVNGVVTPTTAMANLTGQVGVPTIAGFKEEETTKNITLPTTNTTGNGNQLDVMNPYCAINYYISTGKSLIS